MGNEITNEAIYKALARPFADSAVKSKNVGKGMQARYVTARVVMNRLDEVLSPANWTAEYTPFGQPGSVLCRLTVLLPDGTKATKCDVGQPGDGEDDKSAVSDALKRAAVQIGVGRYLYNDGTPRFYGLENMPAAKDPNPASEGKPKASRPEPDRVPGFANTPPPPGLLLFERAKIAKALPWFQRLGRAWDFPAEMKDWTADQCQAADREWEAQQPKADAQRVPWGGGRS